MTRRGTQAQRRAKATTLRVDIPRLRAARDAGDVCSYFSPAIWAITEGGKGPSSGSRRLWRELAEHYQTTSPVRDVSPAHPDASA